MLIIASILICSLLVFLVFKNLQRFDENKRDKIYYFIKLGFFIGLLLMATISLSFEFLFSITLIKVIVDLLLKSYFYRIVYAISFGFIFCILLFLWYYFIFKKYNTQKKERIYSFLKLGLIIGFVIVITVTLLFGLAGFRQGISSLKLITDITYNNYFYLILLTVSLGFLTFSFDRERIIEEIKYEKINEIQAEKKRQKEFKFQYSRNIFFKGNDNLNQPNNKNKKPPALILYLRSIMTFIVNIPNRFIVWIYGEGLFYSVGLFMILVLGSIIQLHIIGDYYYWTDEVFSFNAGKMILEKGKPLFDSGLFYGRARIYHYVMAGGMYLFGVDEFGSRIVNVIANIFTALIIYYILRRTSKKLGLVGAMLFMFSNSTMASTIETRFYSFFTCLFLGMVYTYYKSFIENINDDSFNKISITFRKKIIWILLFVIFSYLSFNTHNFFFIAIFGISLYYFLSLVLDKSMKTNLIFLICCIGIVYYGSYHLTGSFNLYHSYVESVTLSWALDLPKNPGYYLDILKQNILFLNIIFTSSIIILLAKFNQLQRYYFSILIGGLFILSIQKTLAERFMSYLWPLIIITIVYAFYFLYICFKKHFITKYIILLIIVLFAASHLQLFLLEINYGYKHHHEKFATYKNFAFQEAMEIINQTLDEDNLLIADFHAAFTLRAYGFDVQYIVVSEDSMHVLNKGRVIDGIIHDEYFHIPYMLQESPDYLDLINNKKFVFVARGEVDSLEGLYPIFDQTPKIYLNYPLPCAINILKKSCLH